MASAPVSDPKPIILDEPVSALDVSIRAQIMNLLVDLQRDTGVSYLLIAHHLATTRYMAREEVILPGEVPSPINPPSGCRFHPRCPFAMARCAQDEPKEQEMAPSHMVACHLY